MKNIFIIGAARSGTTLLADSILSKHPNILYLSEPKFLWDYGNYFKGHDILTEKDVNKFKTNYINKVINKFQLNSNKKIILEKTPSNCFRLPYLKKIFPEAKFIHIIRDGRDVAISSSREWKGIGGAIEHPELRRGNIFEQIYKTINLMGYLKVRITNLRSIIYLILSSNRLIILFIRKIFGKSDLVWGPRFPGLKQVRKSHSLLETCAIQWDMSVRSIKNYFGESDKNYLEIKYENLIEKPKEQLGRIMQFLKLDTSQKFIDDSIKKIVYQKLPKYPNLLTSSEISSIEKQISFSLKNLGYKI